MLKVQQPKGDDNHIYGILYGDSSGDLYLLNDSGAYRVVVEIPDSLLQPVRRIVEAETTDIKWIRSGEVETWESGILDDLLHDMKNEGQNPESEIVYIARDCRTVVLCNDND